MPATWPRIRPRGGVPRGGGACTCWAGRACDGGPVDVGRRVLAQRGVLSVRSPRPAPVFAPAQIWVLGHPDLRDARHAAGNGARCRSAAAASCVRAQGLARGPRAGTRMLLRSSAVCRARWRARGVESCGAPNRPPREAHSSTGLGGVFRQASLPRGVGHALHVQSAAAAVAGARRLEGCWASPASAGRSDISDSDPDSEARGMRMACGVQCSGSSSSARPPPMRCSR